MHPSSQGPLIQAGLKEERLRDLVDCDDVSEHAILCELEARFRRDVIYSSIGPILIAVNPFKTIGDLYATDVKDGYVQSSISGREDHYTSSHVWKVAGATYVQLLKTSQPQAIVISGESGAGKTEATKQCLQLLSAISSHLSGHYEGTPIEERVLATNPILESFGNSKTSRNNNSSRFGKWIQLNYRETTDRRALHLTGAAITQYLLEKSRVVVHSSEERNYHIFYQLCANAVLDLQPASNYRYLRFGKVLSVPGIDDRLDFENTMRSMDELGFSASDKSTLFSALKAILLLGNLMFRVDSNDEESDKAAVIGGDFQPLVHNICQLLSLRVDDLSAGLTGRTMTVRGETTRISFTVEQAQNTVNSFAKEIYGRLFSFIVYQANQSLREEIGIEDSTGVTRSVGVLDIFGFEKFKFNSFEQLCINYANEKLHQYFIAYVLKKEQELYELEGIESVSVVLVDNADVLQLIEGKKNGILARLDDEIKVPKGSDESFLKKVEGDFNLRGQALRRFVRDVKMLPTHFEIRHFAGQILYDCSGFLEKNKDKLYDHLEVLLSSSTNLRFRELMSTDWNRVTTGESVASAKFAVSSVTIGSRFQAQLQSLMDMLQASQPHFIKCIKPNNSKHCEMFEEELVVQQLRYSGVLEAIQIRKSGYPTRRSHSSFWKDYWMVPSFMDRSFLLTLPDAEKCRFIMDAFENFTNGIKLGKTMVFLRPNVAMMLENEKDARRLKASLLGQSHFRRRRAYKTFKAKRVIRDKLRIAQANANRFRASNVQAIGELQVAITMAKLNELPATWISVAEKLLSRLFKIKDCLDQLGNFTEDGQSGRDVIDEYNSLASLVETAECLEIDTPHIAKVKARLMVLRDRAECVQSLRSAIAHGDEVHMKECLEQADRLTVSFGKFCEEDERVCRLSLALLEEDHVVAQRISDSYVAFQSKLRGALASESTAEGPMKSLFAEFESSLTQALQLWASRPPQSKHNACLHGVVDIIRAFHMNWSMRNWTNAMELAERLAVDRDDLLGMIDRRLPKVVQYVTQLVDCVTTDIDLVQRDIEVNVLLPTCLDALENGHVEGIPGCINLFALDTDALVIAVQNFRAFPWTDKSVEPVLSLLESFAAVKALFKDRCWLKVVSKLETPEQRAARHRISLSWTAVMKQSVRYQEQDMVDVESSLTGAAGEIYVQLQEVDVLFSPICTKIQQQIGLMLLEAVDQSIQACLVAAIVSETPTSLEIFTSEVEFHTRRQIISSALEFGRSTLSLYTSPASLSIPSPACLDILLLLEAALVIWQLVDEQAWSQILVVWDQGATIAVSASELSIALEPVRKCCISIVLLALTQDAVASVTAEIVAQCFSFNQYASPVHDSQPSSVKLLRRAVEQGRAKFAKFSALHHVEAQLIEDVDELFALADQLASARDAFWSNEFSDQALRSRVEILNGLRDAFHRYASSPYVYEVAPYFIKETQEMELATRFVQVLNQIRLALKPENADLHYFILAPPGAVATNSRVRAKRPMSMGSTTTMPSPAISSPALTRQKSLTFDTNLPAHSTSSFEDILIEEGLVFNQAMLTPNNLNEALESAHEFLSELESCDDLTIPASIHDHVSALEAIRDLRCSVYDEDWSGAFKLLSDLQSLGLISKVAEIQEEIQANVDTIRNYTVIMTCHTALSKGAPVGAIGHVDYKNLSWSALDDAVKVCQTVGCSAERAQALLDAVLVISDLRKAQKLGDWTEIRAVLARADSQRIGEGLTVVCCGEISKACIERDNYEVTHLLKAAIVNEEMFSKEGILEMDQVSTKELASVIGRVQSMPEDSRGALLRSLAILADSVLKARKCALLAQWQHVESLLPVIKENMENFQNELESKDKQLTRKTMSFRTTSFRTGSVMAGAKDKHRSILPADLPGSSTPGGGMSPAGRSASWEEYAELTQSVKREVRAIEHHFAVQALEKRLMEALMENGPQTNVDATLHTASVEIEDLHEVLEEAAGLDLSSLSLPKHLKALRKVGMLVHDIRQALLKEQWGVMNSLLEESLGGDMASWPECSRLEIQIVRGEVENRWIVSNLTSAINMGKLEGAVGHTVLSSVSNSHLPSYIETAKSLNPRTELSLSLLRTTEALHALRGLLLPSGGQAPDWQHVRKQAKEILDGIRSHAFHTIIEVEVRLILDTAEDKIVCEMVLAAMACGGPSGEPGALISHGVVTKELEKAYNVAVRSTIKTSFAKALLSACRTLQKLREAVQRVHAFKHDQHHYNTEAWRTIKALLTEVFEAQSIANTNAVEEHGQASEWDVCMEEITLIHKHTIVEDLKASIVASSTQASHVYNNRNSHVSSTELSPTVIQQDRVVELAEAMESIFNAAERHEFSCLFLLQYRLCAFALSKLRRALGNANTDELLTLLQDEQTKKAVSVLKEAKLEYGWIVCEYHNLSAIQIVCQVLIGGESSRELSSSEAAIRGTEQGFRERNERLGAAVKLAKNFTLTSKLAWQWVECCENMYTLRWNLEHKQHHIVNQALRWFKNSAKTCPLVVKMEAQRAYVIYQNGVLIQDLSIALHEGKAVGKVGEVNLDAIQVESLQALVTRARAVDPLFRQTQELVDAAAIALKIRMALKNRDTQLLHAIVDDLAAQDRHSLLIIDEIATARAELDNGTTVDALVDALRSFEDSESRAFDISFWQENSSDAAKPEKQPADSPRPVRKSGTHSILESLSERRYSYANKNNANIDPDTIDIDVLDGGLRVARDHGVHSAQAVRLYRTVELVRSLRLAMKQADWALLEEILVGARYEQEVGEKFDFLASKEILAVRSQLEMRAAIVDLSKALRLGWAKCSQGIVDCSGMENERLANAIDCADRCITELSIQISTVHLLSDENATNVDNPPYPRDGAIHRKVSLLMESAKLVLRVREVLAMGNMELAGSLAEEALSRSLHHSVVEELRLYAKEINIALNALNITETLRRQVASGHISSLAAAIGEAFKLESHLSNDLGLIRVIDRAERAHERLLSTRLALQHAVEATYNPADMESALKLAKAYNFSDPQVAQCEERLEKLSKLQSVVEDFDAIWTCVRNERGLMRRVLEEATVLKVPKHPQCALIKLFLRAAGPTLRGIKMRAALRPAPRVFAITSETTRIKKQFLEQPSSQQKFRLEQFARLRRPEEFAQRTTLLSDELLRTMLIHTDQPLPTSLTSLSPPFAAVAVHLFSSCIRGIEHNIYSFVAVAVRQVVELGCTCVHLRDEILLQIVKQIRQNPDPEATRRLWRLLCACLFHFPPSSALESHLEGFLLESVAVTVGTGFASRCQRFLHRVIFLHGQGRKVQLGARDFSRFEQWLASDDFVPEEAQWVPGWTDKPLSHYEQVFGSVDCTDTSSASAAVEPQATTGRQAGGTKGGASGSASRVRGSRDDWVARFRAFHSKDASRDRDREGGSMSRVTFCSQLAQAITAKSTMDVADRRALCYLVFCQRVLDIRSVARELVSDREVFHFISDDEAACSSQRLEWLWARVYVAMGSSESPPDLFFAQLQLSDAVALVERFWDSVVDKMSRECRQFPFLRVSDRRESIGAVDNEGMDNPTASVRSLAGRKSAGADKLVAVDVSINWEIFRELVLTGMRLSLHGVDK